MYFRQTESGHPFNIVHSFDEVLDTTPPQYKKCSQAPLAVTPLFPFHALPGNRGRVPLPKPITPRHHYDHNPPYPLQRPTRGTASFVVDLGMNIDELLVR